MDPGGTPGPPGTDPELAQLSRAEGMRFIEVEPGRWRLELGRGLGLELILLFSRSVAFWRFGGELVAEVLVGEG